MKWKPRQIFPSIKYKSLDNSSGENDICAKLAVHKICLTILKRSIIHYNSQVRVIALEYHTYGAIADIPFIWYFHY